MPSIDKSDLVESLYLRGESSMNTEDLFVNNSCKSEVIKYICAILPYIGVTVFTDYFIIETVYLSDLTGLVIAS